MRKDFVFALVCVIPLTVSMLTGCRSAKERSNKPEDAAAQGTPSYNMSFPLGLVADSAVLPASNRMNTEKIKLGKRLYFEKALSIDGSLSCSTCHIPDKGFSESEQFSAGVGGKKGTRHAPTIINRVFSASQFWDGRAASLEEQALGPVQNPAEMGMPNMRVVVERLQEDSTYIDDFRAAFPPAGEITPENVAKAITCFERTILFGNSPYDRFAAGDRTALSEAAQRGMKIFKDENKGNCETCHAGPNFTDEGYNNIGVGMSVNKPDMGRYAVTRLDGYQGAFRTQTLRDVARRGPYMHDGSQKTLEEVVDFYVRGGHKNKWLSPKIHVLRLNKQEQQDLVEFLKALSGEVGWYGKGGHQ